MTATSTDRQAIKQLLSTYARSLNTSDAELAATLYAPDGVFIPLFLPTASGEEIVTRYRQIFDAIKLDVAFTIDDITIDGDTAHGLTSSEGHVTELSSGKRSPESNRELFVFGRYDGEWKVTRYMFNKTRPPAD